MSFLIKTAYAQTGGLIDPLGGQGFAQVAASVIAFIFWDVAVPLCTIMVLVGAFQMMTAAGDPEKFGKGRKTVLYAAVGFAVALIAGGLVSVLKQILGA